MIGRTTNVALWNAAINGQLLRPDYNLIWDFAQLQGNNRWEWGDHNITDSEPEFEGASFRLRNASSGIDDGRPDLLDPDGTRSDIGVYGGPYAYPPPE